jgi:protein-S-isoprenylcysteine O-methyltransferase Ste14
MGPVTTTLLLQAAFVLLAFGWRTLAQIRATGSTGFVAHRERGLVAKAAGLALTLGLLAVVAGTVLADSRDWDALAVVGVVAMLGGLVLCLAAQRSMGLSWRIGVDPDERTDLVTTGLFGSVRNPIFTAMILFAAGSALAVPTAVTVLGLVLAVVGIAAQVLVVEEPHLRRQHGAVYAAYVARSGRFLPRLARTDRAAA